jgi:hypothetical protein
MTATANVIQLSANGDIDEDSRAEIMQTVRDELYSYDKDGLESIALWIGKSTSTLYAIRSGRTLWPRHSTLFPLLRRLGFRLVLTRTTR